jgi:hypothetical protein
MEFWLDKSRVAFTTQPKGIASVTLDVWEQSSVVSLPFKFTASFMSEIDARVYLTAKYPHALEKIIVEKIANADEVDSSLSVTRPTPPYDLRDDAWRKYRDDSRRFREAISGGANA